MLSKEAVLDRLDVALHLKGRDHKTRESYCRVAGKFYDFALRCPREWSSEQKAEAYLTERVRRDRISASSQNHDLAALNALYESQGRKLGNVDALRAKRHVYERHCPTNQELRALLETLVDSPGVPARTLALLMAGTGLRVDEALSARLKDFRREGERVSLVVREPKHGHDRVVKIPGRCVRCCGARRSWRGSCFSRTRSAGRRCRSRCRMRWRGSIRGGRFRWGGCFSFPRWGRCGIPSR